MQLKHLAGGALLLAGLLGLTQTARAEDQAPEGTALVYVIAGSLGSYADVLVYVDGKSPQSLAENSYIKFALDPGTHEISSAGARRGALSLKVGRNNTYYVSQTMQRGDPEFKELSESEGVTALASARAMQTDVVQVGGTQAESAPGASRNNDWQDSGSRRSRSGSTDRDHFAMVFRGGGYQLTELSQIIGLGGTFAFEEDSTSVGGLDLEWRDANGFTPGLEVFTFSNRVASIPALGLNDMQVVVVSGTLKKYFNVGGVVYPYIGGGIGVALASFTGADLNGETVGGAYQGMVGLELRFGHIGLHGQYKYLGSTTTSAAGEEVIVSGKGANFGISFMF